MAHHFAKEVVLDHRTGTVEIDGVPFDYYVAADADVEIDPSIITVRLGLYADNVTVVSKSGERKTVSSEADPGSDSEWTRRTARRIVLEGMADVLEWLDEARQQYVAEAERFRELADAMASAAGRARG